MKKITRANFEGLRQRYPVLNKEKMRRYVGGNSTTLYDESDLALLNVYTLDIDMDACSAVGSDKDDEMEEDVWTSDLGICAFSAGDYGFGGYSFYGNSDGSYGYEGDGWDVDYGYLDEVVIYGNKPNNDYGYYGGSAYPGWGDGYGDGDGYWGEYSYSYVMDGYYGYGEVVGPTDCVAQTLAAILGKDANEIDAWIRSQYGPNGVPGDKYYEVLSHYLNGSPTPIPPFHYQYGVHPQLIASVKTSNGNGHSVIIMEIKGTDVTYLDPQNNNSIGTCNTLDITHLYRVDGKK